MSDALEVHVDPTSPALKILTQLEQKMGNISPLMEKVAAAMLIQVKLNFAAGGRPIKWPPYSPASRKSGQVLLGKISLYLKSSVEDGSKAVVSSNNKIAVIQHEGAVIPLRKGQGWTDIRGVWHNPTSVTIPARRFMNLTDEAQEMMMKIVQVDVEESLK